MNSESHIAGDTETALQKILQTGPLRLLLAGMYFLLGVRRVTEVTTAKEAVPYTPCYALNRKYKRKAMARRRARVVKLNTKNLTHLKAFMPDGISQTQFLERCTKLSIMGRLRVYDFMYYRWEFWRIGAMAKRCQSTLPATGAAVKLQPFGLSAVHLGPD